MGLLRAGASTKTSLSFTFLFLIFAVLRFLFFKISVVLYDRSAPQVLQVVASLFRSVFEAFTMTLLVVALTLCFVQNRNRKAPDSPLGPSVSPLSDHGSR